MKKKIKIEIQYFKGCPNSSEMIRRVKEAISGHEELVDYSELLIENNDLAEKVKFRGSPTVLINGEDLENRKEPESAAMNCRVFENGLPEVEEIKDKIFSVF